MSKIDKIKVGETTYNIGANAADIEGLETTQYSTMPTAGADNVGKIVQYTGTTDTNYTNGLFYKCELVNDSYVWSNIIVQNIPTFTNSSLGVIKGSSSDGYVNANNDGTGNINGWESIKNKRVFYSDYVSYKCFCQCYSFVCFNSIVKSLNGNTSYNKTIGTILSDAQNNYDPTAFYNFVYIDFMDKAHTKVSMTITLSSNPSSSTRYLASTIVLSAKQTLPPSFGLAEIYFTYNNGYTINSIDLNADNVLSFLSTNNTTAYSPTSDYHPATKKYVDDHSAPSGVVPEFVFNLNTGTNRQTDFSFFKSVYDYCNDNNFTEFTTGLIFNATSHDESIGVGSVKFTKYSSGQIIYFIVLYPNKSFRGPDYQYYQPGSTCTFNFYNSDYTIDSSGHITFTKAYWTPAITNLLLPRNNAESYTPTDNYHPATKKYVDDKAATKQDTLTAGTNITIENNVISATGSSGGETPSYIRNETIDGSNKKVDYFSAFYCNMQFQNYTSTTDEFGKKLKNLINKILPEVDSTNSEEYLIIEAWDYNRQRIKALFNLKLIKSKESAIYPYTTYESYNGNIYRGQPTSNVYYSENDVSGITLNNLTSSALRTLGIQNSDSFTPTNNYHPATKKYVDDSVATKQDTLTAGTGINIVNNVISALGGGDFDIYTFDASQTFVLKDKAKGIYVNTRPSTENFSVQYDTGYPSAGTGHPIWLVFIGEDFSTLPDTGYKHFYGIGSLTSIGSSSSAIANFDMYISASGTFGFSNKNTNAYTLSSYNQTFYGVKTFYDTPVCSNVPSADGDLSNKKYVDDSVSAIAVPTKTSDLTNDSGFLTSIPNAAASVTGGIKMRYDATTSTLYIRNDGTDA